MVNKGQIHMEIRKFMMISLNLIKSDNELMIEIRKMVDYERELQNVSTELKIIEFDFDFAEKFNIEIGRDFRNIKS